MSATIAAGVARALLDLAVAKGARRHVLMQIAGIGANSLQDADARVRLEIYVRLRRAAKQILQEPALGLHFGEAYQLQEFSILGAAGAPAGSIGDGLDPLNRFSRLAVDVGTAQGERFRLQADGGMVWLEDGRPDADAFHELTESTFARIVTAFRRAGVGAFVKQVHFTHADPGYGPEYDRIFQVPVRFGAPANALGLDAQMLARQVAAPPPYMHAAMVERAEALLQRLDREQSFTGKVERALRASLPEGGANVQTVAARLGMSRQTVFRKLKAEGTSFGKLLQDLRRQLAEEHICERETPIPELAHLLGYADRAAFSKAFKRWTGHSPARARHQLTG